MGDLYNLVNRGGRVRKFSRNLMYTCTALAALALTGVGVTLGSYKTVKLNVDGQVREIHTFKRLNVSELLKQQGISVAGYDVVEPSLTSALKPSQMIWVDHATKVLLRDGTSPTQVIMTQDKTVGSILQHAGIQIGDTDAVNVRLDSPPIEGQTIIINRKSQDTAYSEEPIPFQTERQPNSSMYKGDEKVLSPGVEGLVKITTKSSYVNGKLADQQSTRDVVKQPQNRVIEYGTEDHPVILASRSEASFQSGASYTMVATAYAAPGGRTAMGLPAKQGVVAVDPSIIPLGTHLYIDGYGYAIAADTGGAIQGNRIDLCFNSESEAIAFGRRGITVHVVK